MFPISDVAFVLSASIYTHRRVTTTIASNSVANDFSDRQSGGVVSPFTGQEKRAFQAVLS
jgi:hypothetical protein